MGKVVNWIIYVLLFFVIFLYLIIRSWVCLVLILLVCFNLGLRIVLKYSKTKKIIFVSSTGGHLSELLQLHEIIINYDYHIITEKTKSTISLKEKYSNKVSYLIYGTRTEMITFVFKFCLNTLLSYLYILKVRPKAIISTGTHSAVPLCYIGKSLGVKIVFIETIANSETKTLSGKLVYPISDLFLVQWKSMLKVYPNAVYGGWIY